ncbi:hypothetical protein LXL04_032100 [Taraxacum kok-saghyz]
MASSSSSSSGLRRATHLDYQNRCNCGLPSRVLTSGTTKNPDRRFLVCSKSQDEATNEMEEIKVVVEELKQKLHFESLAVRKEMEELKTGLEKVKTEMLHLKQNVYKINGFLCLGGVCLGATRTAGGFCLVAARSVVVAVDVAGGGVAVAVAGGGGVVVVFATGVELGPAPVELGPAPIELGLAPAHKKCY